MFSIEYCKSQKLKMVFTRYTVGQLNNSILKFESVICKVLGISIKFSVRQDKKCQHLLFFFMSEGKTKIYVGNFYGISPKWH